MVLKLFLKLIQLLAFNKLFFSLILNLNNFLILN